MFIPKYFSLIKKLNKNETKKIKSLIKRSKKSVVLIELFEVVLKMNSYDKAKIASKLSSNSVKYYNVYSKRLYNLILHFLSTENMYNDNTIKANLWINEINVLLYKWMVEDAQTEIKNLENFIHRERLYYLIPSLHELQYSLKIKTRIRRYKNYQPQDLKMVSDEIEYVKLYSLSKYLLVNMFDYVNKYSLLDYNAQNLELEDFIPQSLQDKYIDYEQFPTNVNYYRALGIYHSIKRENKESVEYFDKAINIYDNIRYLKSDDKIKLIYTVGSILNALVREIEINKNDVFFEKTYHYLEKLEYYCNIFMDDFKTATQCAIKQYSFIHFLNTYTMLGDSKKGDEVIEEIIAYYNTCDDKLKRYEVANYLNIGTFYFTKNDFSEANAWTKKALNLLEYKTDIKATKYALSLELIINLELNNYELLENLNRSYARHIKNSYPNLATNKNFYSVFIRKAIKIAHDRNKFDALIDETLIRLYQKQNRHDIHFHFALFEAWLKAKQRKISIASLLWNKTQMHINLKKENIV